MKLWATSSDTTSDHLTSTAPSWSTPPEMADALNRRLHETIGIDRPPLTGAPGHPSASGI
jgi:hypothetical protein